MNCLNPIYIANPSKKYLKGSTKAFLQVPCGHCEACRQQRIADWSLRIYEHMQDYIQRGGYTIFPTLTYDNDHLPYISVPNDKTFTFSKEDYLKGNFHGLEFDGRRHIRLTRNTIRDLCVLKDGYFEYKPSSLQIPAFNRDHIQKFFNSLRKHFERLGISDLSYFVACEYGSETKRPHYHALIHVPNQKVPSHELREIIKRLWSYGMVMYSELGAEVSSFAAARYVGKYVCKDLEYSARMDIFALSEDYKSYVREREVLDDEKAAYWDYVKKFLPTHWQGKGYGISLIKNLGENEKLFEVLLNGYRIPLTETKLQVPQYIKNKLLFEVDKDGCRQLSPLGVKFMKYRYAHDIENISKKLKEELSQFGISKYLHRDEDVNLIKGIPQIHDLTSLSRHLRSLMDGYTYDDLAVFKRVYFGYTPSVDAQSLLEYTTEDFLECAYDVYMSRFDFDIDDYETIEMDRFDKHHEHTQLYDNLPQFKKFSEIFDILTQIHQIQDRRKVQFQIHRDQAINKVKKLYQKLY